MLVFITAGNGITGAITQSFGELVSLVELDSSTNRHQAEIPSSISLCGHIPAALEQLHSLKRLDISSNSLSGEIPGGLVNLENLTALFLNNNKLSGKIPSGFAKVASRAMVNVCVIQ